MKKKISLKNLLPVLLPVLIAFGALAVFAILPKDDTYMVEGAVEIASYSCFAAVSGTVESVPVETGQQVLAGDVLAVIDDRAIDEEAAQLGLVLEMKDAQLRRLMDSPERDALLAARRAAQDQVTICQEGLKQAQRVLTAAQGQLSQQRQLYEIGAISRAELDQYAQAAEQARSQVVVAEAQLSAAENNVETIVLPEADEQAIAAAQADLDLTRLQMEQLEARREDYVIRASADGVVLYTAVEPGSAVAAGQSVFRLSRGSAQSFVFYLPQEYLDQVAFGDELVLHRQGSREETARSRVTYIDLQAVYPPDDYENDSNRNKRSVKVKAEVTDGGPFAVGQSLFLRLDAVR